MKQVIATILVAGLAVSAAQAEEDRGLTLMERGAQLFMEGILKEMEPAIEEFEGLAEEMGPSLRMFAEEMGPKLRELFSEIEDWSVYEAPEVLPNGDIIIRRKPEAPNEPPSASDEPGEPIDL